MFCARDDYVLFLFFLGGASSIWSQEEGGACAIWSRQEGGARWKQSQKWNARTGFVQVQLLGPLGIVFNLKEKLSHQTSQRWWNSQMEIEKHRTAAPWGESLGSCLIEANFQAFPGLKIFTAFQFDNFVVTYKKSLIFKCFSPFFRFKVSCISFVYALCMCKHLINM